MINKFIDAILGIITRIILKLKWTDVIKSNCTGNVQVTKKHEKMLQLATNEEHLTSNHEMASIKTIKITYFNGSIIKWQIGDSSATFHFSEN